MHRIDVHHHFMPRAYVSAMNKMGIMSEARKGSRFKEWNPDISLGFMERHGIKSAILSGSRNGVYFGDAGFAAELARECNESADDAVKTYPDRFGFFAILPMPAVDSAVKEAVYALDTLKADGIGHLSGSESGFLGDPEFDELMEALDTRKAAVFVHPSPRFRPVTSGSIVLRHASLLEFPFDTTRCAVNLTFNGVLERYPRIKWILAHAGGTLPYIAWRISLFGYLPEIAEKTPRGAISYFKDFYYDTSLSASHYTMRSLEEIAEPSHILFGSDFPLQKDSEPVIKEQTEAIGSPGFFKKSNSRMVETENALSLFPRFAEYFSNADV